MELNINKCYYIFRTSDLSTIPGKTENLHLYYYDNVLPTCWPSNITFLETRFRQDFQMLPETLVTLSIVSQNEVIKKDLPINIKYLCLTAPNSITTKFNVREDNYYLYKIV